MCTGLSRAIPAFNEGAIRETLLNAVAHRDYRLAGSVFVRQFPDRIEIVSPGGFPPGITAENLLDRQYPRNRRLAEALARCGFVERSGQGANRIFEACVRESKPLPDFSQSDAWQVSLTLRGQVRDPGSVRFLELVSQEFGEAIRTHDVLVLDLVHREQPIAAPLSDRLTTLRALGVLESVGRGRGQKWMLARRFYEFLGEPGTYTQRRGLDHETNKELLVQHIHG
ncbi:MAG: ATP-binding protein, partial [Fibrobacterota bacterium]